MGTFTSLNLQLLTTPNGTVVLDATPYLTSLSFDTGEHGFASLRAEVQVPLATAYQIYSRNTPLHLKVCDGPCIAWEGRVEDAGVDQQGDAVAALTLSGFGYWNALADVPYTALWSNRTYNDWEIVSNALLSNRTPDRYSIDFNSRIYIGLTKNTVYGTTGTASPNIGSVRYRVPSGGATTILALAFDYTITAPGNYGLAIYAVDASYTGFTLLGNIVSTGTTLTSSSSVTMAGATYLQFDFYLQSGTATNGGENGDSFALITNVRMKATTSTAVYADEIARALVIYSDGINPTQLSSSTTLIQSPAVDLTDEVYEDQYPADILTTLAGYTRWETGVYENQSVYFRPKNSAGRSWLVDVDSQQLERTLSALFNSVYAVYKDASGGTLRSATSTDATSLAQAGITRRQAVQADTTSSTQATAIRDASLIDTKMPIPRASISFQRVYTTGGAQAALWMVRAGDSITIRNLPITLGTAVDRVRTFRVSRTSYNAMDGTLSVEPEQPLPTLPILVAAQ